MSLWALLPFRGAAGAKRRLRHVLTEAERGGLVQAMVRDVLAALCQSDGLAGVLLVSRDADAPALAREFAIDVFAESATNLPGAVAEASTFAAQELGATGTLFLPGDVPLVTPADVAAVLDGHEHVTLVPDGNDIGTNAAAVSPPNAFPYVFDGKSFKPHMAAARKAGYTPRIVRREGLALDVDTAAELAAVARQAAGTKTGEFLEAHGIVQRLASCE